MARHRKIPARKHHGIRDPLKQQEVKHKQLKNVINNPPIKGSDEKLTFKFRQFKNLVDRVQKGKSIKPLLKRIGKEDLPKTVNKESDKKFGRIQQFANENDATYLRRVNRITKDSLIEAQYEAKYGVKIVRDPITSNISIKKKPKNEIDELIKSKRNQQKVKKNGRKGSKAITQKPIDPKIAKELIKEAIKQDKEEKSKESSENLEYKKDVFKFGEVVHAPPTLLTLPRKAEKSETVARPGKKNNLLLKSLLDDKNETSQIAVVPSKKNQSALQKTPTKAQLKGKRKELAPAIRSMLETEQSKMVELYRNLKKNKIKSLQ